MSIRTRTPGTFETNTLEQTRTATHELRRIKNLLDAVLTSTTTMASTMIVDEDDNVITELQTLPLNLNLLYGFGDGAWQRLITDTSNRLVVALDAVPLPTGAATEAKQDTIITEILAQGLVLDNIETYTLRNSWTTIPGNTVTMTYYGGVVAGNPSGALTNVQTAVYSDGGVVFTQTFTYDVNNNILTIVVS